MNISKFFIDRPIFAGVLSVLILLGGHHRAVQAADLRVPGSGAAVGRGARAVSGREPEGDRRNGRFAARRADQRRREHAVHAVAGEQRRQPQHHRHVQARHRSGQGDSNSCRTAYRRRCRACREDVQRLGVTTIKSSPTLTMVVHLNSPNGRYDMTYLRNYALINVKDRLARIPGVGQVQLWGSGDYSMRVWLDPQKVAQRGMTATRCRQRDPRAERAGRGRRDRRRRRRCRTCPCS